MPIVSAFRFVLRLIGVALVAFLPPALLAQSSSPVVDGFDPNVNGNVYAVAVQPDGKVLVAGLFTTLQPNGSTAPVARTNIARLNADGSVDATFNADVGGQINAMVLQANGQIVVGGRFTAAGGATRNRVARLNANGTLDSGFDPNIGGGFTPEVTSLALQPDGRLIVGGGFTSVQPNGAATATPRGRVARFNSDGTLDAGFNPNANSMVLSLAVQQDGKVLIGGGFTSLQPNGATAATVRNRIARVNSDGSLDTGFDPSANNAVSAIEVLPDGQIIIGGSFTTLKPNGATDAVTTNVTRLARLNPNGTVNADFRGYAEGQVYTLKGQADGSVLVGGTFSSLGTGGRSYFGRLLPNGTLDFSYSPNPNFAVYAVAVQADGSAVIGGGFTTLRGAGVNSIVRNHVARVLASGAFDADFRPDVNGRLHAVAVQSDGKLLVVGSFTAFGGATRSGIARLEANGALDPSFRADIDGPVVAVATDSTGKILVGGGFSRVNGVSRFNFARLNSNGTLDTSFDFPVDSTVNAIAVTSDNKIILGGLFASVRPAGGTEVLTRRYIVRVNSDATLDTAFFPVPNQEVSALAVQADGKILLGGDFSSIVGSNSTASFDRAGIARLNADGTVDSSFSSALDSTVFDIELQSDGKIVAVGNFTRTSVRGVLTDRKYIVRFNADGTLDTAFDPNANGIVYKVVQAGDGKLLIGGRFTSLQPGKTGTTFTRNFVARLNADGTVDPTFDLGLDTLPGNQVVGLQVGADNKILVGGAFTTLQPPGAAAVSRNRLARVNSDGSVDTAFNADLGVTMGAPIEAVIVMSDGTVLASGSFASLGGTNGANLAQFGSDSAPNTNFTPSINGPVYAVAQQPAKGEAVATQKPGFAWLSGSGQLRSDRILPSGVELTSIRAVEADADGKLLVGGFNFTGASSTSLLRFNADGSLDSTFQPTTTGSIFAIKVLSSGKILVAGSFTKVGDVDRSNLALLNADGSLDTAFAAGTDAPVFALAVQSDNKILIGGAFTSVSGAAPGSQQPRVGMARLNTDGSLDATLNPNFDNTVNTIAVRLSGKIVVGGEFTSLRPNATGTPIGRSFLAQLNSDGTVDTAVDFKLNGPVAEVLVQPDDAVLVGGFFSSILDTTRNSLARINANNTLDAFNPNPNSAVDGLALQSDGRILITGVFSALQPDSTSYDPALATPRSRVARLEASGAIDTSFNPNFDDTVNGIVPMPDGSIVVFGTFQTLQPTGTLIVGGSFTTVNSVPAANLAIFGRDGSISSSFRPEPNGAVHAILPLTSGHTVVAGAFTTISGATRNRIARFDLGDNLDAAFNPNVDGDVYALALQPDGRIIIGGSFTTVGGVGRSNIARLDATGAVDSAFNATAAGAVRAIAVQADGRVLFTQATGADTNTLVRVNADGTADAGFAPANNGAVRAIALHTSGHIAVGGSFTAIGGGARTNLARLNPDGTLDASFAAAPNGAVTALSIAPDGKILIGGLFNAVDGLPRFGLARIGAPQAVVETLSIDASRTVVTWVRGAGAPEIIGAIIDSSTDGTTWTPIGTASRIAGTAHWQLNGAALPATTRFFLRARGVIPASPRSSAGMTEVQYQFYTNALAPAPAPVITSATVVDGLQGAMFYYGIGATNQPTNYAAAGLPPGLSVNSTTGLVSGTPTTPGTYMVTLSAGNTGGLSTTTLTLIVRAAAGNPVGNGKLSNVSINAQVTPTEPIIAGFVIKGVFPQTVLVRALGPSLEGIVPGFLSQPHLRLYDSNSVVIAENAGWNDDPVLTVEAARVGAGPFKAGGKDAAMLITLRPGVYTMHVSSANGASGYAIAEVYDASANFEQTWPRLVNLSGRSIIDDAGTVVTGGFVIEGPAARRVLIRAVGPGLSGVPNELSDPTLSLYKSGAPMGTLIASNDNWGTAVTVDAAHPPATSAELSAAFAAAGAVAFANGSNDAAIIVTLAPGAYTAQVGRAGTTSGGAMVEIYELDVP